MVPTLGMPCLRGLCAWPVRGQSRTLAGVDLADAQLRLLESHRARVADRVAEVALAAAGAGDPAGTAAGRALLAEPQEVLASLGVWCVLAQAERERAFREGLGDGADDEVGGDALPRPTAPGAEAVPGALLRRLQPRTLPFGDADAALMLDLAAPWSVEALEFAAAAAEGLVAREPDAPAVRAAAARGRVAFDRRPLGRPMRIRRLSARLEALAGPAAGAPL